MADESTSERTEGEHKPHPWPQADENFCSCCRVRLIDGIDNVVRLQTSPERQLTLKGELRGIEDSQPKYKAYLHASCWKRHFGQVVECEKCGVFSKAKKLSNGTKNTCGCICHDGANRCGYVIDPYTISGMVKKDQNGTR